VKGLLIDGPGAGHVIDAGDPPARRGIVVLRDGGFAEDAYRYYLSSIDANAAMYTFGGEVPWPPEAGSQIVRTLVDAREHAMDSIAPGARHNGE
jgi:hypothetical protein